MNRIILKEQVYNFTIERRERRSLAIVIDHQDYFRVLTPKNVSEGQIREAIMTKSDWISSKLQAFNEREKYRPQRTFKDGDLFYYFGQAVHLKLMLNGHSTKPIVQIQGSQLIVTVLDYDQKRIMKAIELFYKNAAQDFVKHWVPQYERALGVQVNRILIKAQKKRWGSCSSLGNVNFNFRCAMLPESVFQYIVVHEMAHLVHLNHSKNFWGLVNRMCPDHKTIKQWLKANALAFDF